MSLISLSLIQCRGPLPVSCNASSNPRVCRHMSLQRQVPSPQHTPSRVRRPPDFDPSSPRPPWTPHSGSQRQFSQVRGSPTIFAILISSTTFTFQGIVFSMLSCFQCSYYIYASVLTLGESCYPSFTSISLQVLRSGMPSLCVSRSWRPSHQSGFVARTLSHTPSLWRPAFPWTSKSLSLSLTHTHTHTPLVSLSIWICYVVGVLSRGVGVTGQSV